MHRLRSAATHSAAQRGLMRAVSSALRPAQLPSTHASVVEPHAAVVQRFESWYRVARCFRGVCASDELLRDAMRWVREFASSGCRRVRSGRQGSDWP